MQIKLSRTQLITAGLFILLYTLLIYSTISLMSVNHFQHFTLQAESFLKGRLDIPDLSRVYNVSEPTLDFNLVDGKYYWPLGFFPAILMMPLVVVGNALGVELVSQGFLQIFINIGVIFLAYKIARKIGYHLNDALALAMAFSFGSIYIIVMLRPYSWYFSQGVTVILMLVSIWIYLTREKYSKFVIGLLYAGILLTRPTAAFPVVFFALLIWRDRKIDYRQKMLELLKLGGPLLLGFILMSWMNYARFGNPFDNGYMTALIWPEIQLTMRAQFGLFKLDNILSNLYIYFLMPFYPVFAPGTYHLVSPFLEPNPVGMSFFITSPIFTWLLLKWREIKKVPDIKFILLSTLPVLGVLLTYYASGFTTYGPRYLLDIFPFIYLVLLYVLPKKKLTKFQYGVIIFSILLNLYLTSLLYNSPNPFYWKS